MHQLFPSPDSLCLNFGRTALFHLNNPDSSTLKHTTEWPQLIAEDLARRTNQGGITLTRADPQPHMPYVIFRNMSPHFDSHANSGIPCIKGMEHQFYSSRINARRYINQQLQLLHLLPHLQLSDVGTYMEHRIGDQQRERETVFIT